MTSRNRLRKCLICNNSGKENLVQEVNFFESPNSTENVFSESIEAELSVLFVVRNVLGISSKFCEDLISCKGNPSSWGLTFCSGCVQLIQEAQLVFRRIRELVDHSDELHRKLREVVWSSFAEDGNDAATSRRTIRSKVEPIADKLRQQFHKVAKRRTGKCGNVNSRYTPTESIPELPDIVIKTEISSSDDDDDEYVLDYGEDISPTGDKDDNTKTEDGKTFENLNLSLSLPPRRRKATVNSTLNSVRISESENSEPEDLTSDWEPPSPNDNEKEWQQSMQEISEVRKPRKFRKLKKGVRSRTELRCTECPKGFRTKRLLSSHTKSAHKSVSGNIEEAKPIVVRQKLNPKPKVCQDCGRKFTRPILLMAHRRVRHSVDPLPPRPPPCRTFLCEICSKAFTQKANLQCHQKAMHYEELGMNPFKCKECGKILSNSRNLDYHMKIVHPKSETDFKFHCPICKRGFMYEFKCQDHLRTFHTFEKPFKCSHCSKSFATKGYLKNHLAVHSTIKPWNCNICSKPFSDNSTYWRHMESHGSTVHECPTCNKKFKVRHTFKIHLKTHSKTPGMVGRKKRNTKKLTKGNETGTDETNEESQEISKDRHGGIELTSPLAIDTCGIEVDNPNFQSLQLL